MRETPVEASTNFWSWGVSTSLTGSFISIVMITELLIFLFATTSMDLSYIITLSVVTFAFIPQGSEFLPIKTSISVSVSFPEIFFNFVLIHHSHGFGTVNEHGHCHHSIGWNTKHIVPEVLRWWQFFVTISFGEAKECSNCE
jgi:hypothetical protein